MHEELARRREECIQLRTVLASHGRSMNNESQPRDQFEINEDGELQMAYKSQKDLNKYVSVLCYYVKTMGVTKTKFNLLDQLLPIWFLSC